MGSPRERAIAAIERIGPCTYLGLSGSGVLGFQGFRVLGVRGFRALGFRVLGLRGFRGLRVGLQDLGLRGAGLGCRVEG